jgi:hypothetical protein
MCGGTAWALEGWQPFVELSRTLETAVQLHAATSDDSSLPLTRDLH